MRVEDTASAPELHQAHAQHVEAVHGALVLEHLHVAAAVPPEVEVVADDHRTRREPVDQDGFDELFRRLAGPVGRRT